MLIYAEENLRTDDDLIVKAVAFAKEAHKGQVRKFNKEPYVTHPIGVGVLLQKYGYETRVAAAGILHDTIEDTPVTADDLEREFGVYIRRLVEEASEPDKSLSWRERKEETIANLYKNSMGGIAIIAADKIHNMLTLCRDLDSHGDAIWDSFTGGKEDQAWYYGTMALKFSVMSSMLLANVLYVWEDQLKPRMDGRL